MTKPRNYFCAAIESLESLGKLAQLGKKDQTTTELKALSRAISDNAVCWHLDDHALQMIWHTDIQQEALDHVRLPYPIMAIEYDFNHQLLGLPPPPHSNMRECRKRVTILLDIEQGSALIDPDVMQVKVREPGFVAYNFFVDEEEPGFWGVTPYIITMPYQQMSDINWSLEERGTRMVELTFSGLVPSMSLARMSHALGVSTEEFIRRSTAQANMMDDLRVSIGLLQLLSCHNRPPVHVVAAPEKLNKARKRRKKFPIPAYRTLYLGSTQSNQTGSSLGASRGPAKTVRGHFRRGHVRRQLYKRLGEHRNIWIEPTWVGGTDTIGHRPPDVEVRK